MGFRNASPKFQETVANRLARPRQYRVLVRRCPTLDPDAARAILRESLQELNIHPSGKVLVKPNVVTANRSYIHHSYTDPRLVRQMVQLIREGGAEKITVGESGGYGIPSRLFMREAGYLDLRRSGTEVVDFNLEPLWKSDLQRGMHHKSMLVPQSLYEADFLAWMPKLKYHICCTITCALKLNVGILTHRERMLFHDDRLDEKIVDLLEIGYPDLVVTDAVEIGTGFESAPRPIHLGALIVADDPVAMDIAACRILGYDPAECTHLTMAMERGYGPASADQVCIEGDMPLEELTAVTKNVVSEYQDIHKTNTSIRFYCGNDPDRDRFCHGGCLAAVKGCLGTIDKRRPGSVAKAREGAIVTGVYKGDVDAGKGIALLVGTCTRVEGEIRAGRVVHVKGCPMGAKQLFFVIPRFFGMPSPLTDIRDALLFILYSIDKILRRGFSGLFGKKIAPRD